MCSLGYSTVLKLITQFRPKVDLGPFGNELFSCSALKIYIDHWPVKGKNNHTTFSLVKHAFYTISNFVDFDIETYSF